ncbi:hypothetical protein PVAP13_3KG370627 [Panicum virgatum]|uniref:Uncharacterized protein n=1 Tax=Panicum virgatum TaxID=38727 RepID=A0A8T0UZB7_PANVG|nr:hypothetical protein PVAP13_3KG370627 [Panicum virgatum]
MAAARRRPYSSSPPPAHGGAGEQGRRRRLDLAGGAWIRASRPPPRHDAACRGAPRPRGRTPRAAAARPRASAARWSPWPREEGREAPLRGGTPRGRGARAARTAAAAAIGRAGAGFGRCCRGGAVAVARRLGCSAGAAPARRGRARLLRREDDGGRPELEPRGALHGHAGACPGPRPVRSWTSQPPALGARRAGRLEPPARRAAMGGGGGPSPWLTSEEAWPDTPWAAPPPWIRLRAAREGGRLAAADRERETESRGGGETDEGKEKKGRIKDIKKRKGKENEMLGGDD